MIALEKACLSRSVGFCGVTDNTMLVRFCTTSWYNFAQPLDQTCYAEKCSVSQSMICHNEMLTTCLLNFGLHLEHERWLWWQLRFRREFLSRDSYNDNELCNCMLVHIINYSHDGKTIIQHIPVAYPYS